MSDKPASGGKRAPQTRPSLLIRIRDGRDRRAWEQFVEIYAPLVFGYARKEGLQESDAADLTQEVLGRVHRAIRKFDYDPQKGKFRGWLLTVTQNALKTFLASAAGQPQGSGDTGIRKLLEGIADNRETDGDFWQAEYHRCLFRWAAARVRVDFRPATWQIFWDATVGGLSAEQVAARHGIGIGTVYTTKSRVLARLREETERMQQEELADF